MAKWTKERYEQIVTLAYEGYTSDVLGARMGLSGSAASVQWKPLKLSLAKIRKARKDGMQLKAILEGIDWGFLKEREEKAHEYRQKGGFARARAMNTANSACPPPSLSADEMRELLTKIREIHAVWCGVENTSRMPLGNGAALRQ